MRWVVDLDDQCTHWDALPYLELIKAKFPRFKVTLFTIPGESTYSDLLKWSALDWVELALHGFSHMIDGVHNPREMQEWSYSRTYNYLNYIHDFYGDLFVRGLKCPGWQISDETYKCLHDLNYWVMDQHYNDNRRPAGLPVYCLNDLGNIHGHTWDCQGGVDNFIGDMIERDDFYQIQPDDDFAFVSEVLYGL